MVFSSLETQSIRQKGLVLIAVPFLTGCIFIITLYLLFSDLGNAVKLERSTRGAMAELDAMYSEFYTCSGLYANFILDGSEPRQTAVLQSLDHLSAEAAAFASPQAVGSISQESRRRISGMMHEFDRFIRALVEDRSSGKRDLVDLAMLRRRFYKMAQPALTEIESILVQKHDELQAVRQSVQIKTNTIAAAVGIGLLLNLFVTAVILRLFSKDLTRRVTVLSDNAFRLTAGAPLLEPVGGNDEIAQIEAAFHRMATDLEQARRAKEEYLAMISHDLRTPLASLTGTMSATARGLYGAISAEGESLAKAEAKNMAALSILVSDLLTYEQLEAGGLTFTRHETALGDMLFSLEEALNDQYGDRPDILERLQFHAPPQKATIETDADKIVLVLRRLVMAAVIDSARQAPIKIDCAGGSGRASFTVSYQASGARPGRKALLAHNALVKVAAPATGAGSAAPNSVASSSGASSSEVSGSPAAADGSSTDPLAAFALSLSLCNYLCEKLDCTLLATGSGAEQSFAVTIIADGAPARGHH